MRRRPWSYPLELCGIVLAVNVVGDWWLHGLPAAAKSFPVKAAAAAFFCLCLTAINVARERRKRPSA
jgi:hypothetical protein